MEEKTFKFNYTWKGFILGILLSIPVIFIAGGGHGWLEPLIIVFPIVNLVGLIFTVDAPVDSLLTAFLLIHYPLYGFLIDYFPNRKAIVVSGIVFFHVISVVMLLPYLGE